MAPKLFLQKEQTQDTRGKNKSVPSIRSTRAPPSFLQGPLNPQRSHPFSSFPISGTTDAPRRSGATWKLCVRQTHPPGAHPLCIPSTLCCGQGQQGPICVPRAPSMPTSFVRLPHSTPSHREGLISIFTYRTSKSQNSNTGFLILFCSESCNEKVTRWDWRAA